MLPCFGDVSPGYKNQVTTERFGWTKNSVTRVGHQLIQSYLQTTYFRLRSVDSVNLIMDIIVTELLTLVVTFIVLIVH